MTPEFSRPLKLDRLTPQGLEITVRAEPEERAALAQRFMVPAILELVCTFRLRPARGGVVEAKGSLSARLERECVASLDLFVETVAEDFTLRFVPDMVTPAVDDLDSPDEIPYTDSIVDLGEAAAEQLALAFDPWPHKPAEAGRQA